jgi:hypothetical protein
MTQDPGTHSRSSINALKATVEPPVIWIGYNGKQCVVGNEAMAQFYNPPTLGMKRCYGLNGYFYCLKSTLCNNTNPKYGLFIAFWERW